MFRHNCAKVCLFSAAIFASASAFAQTVSPVRYDTRNGYSANFHYWDDTYNGSGSPTTDGSPLTGGTGQLTDGVIGGSHYSDNLGNGPAYEWVGWSGNVDVKFFFSSPVAFDNVALHMVQNQDGIRLPSSINFTFSTDGINFGDSVNYMPTTAEQNATTAQWITIATPRTAKYINLNFPNGNPFVSEVRFTGTVVPAPSALVTLLIGAAPSAIFLRRRRK